MSRHISASLRRLIAARAEDLCEYCLIHDQDTSLGCQVEHIISQKHGGLTIEANLALACVYCNRFKGSDIATISPLTGSLCRLFNPRDDRWSEHFRAGGVLILGTSEIGKATAALLGFNAADRLIERQALIDAGNYPSDAARKRMR